MHGELGSQGTGGNLTPGGGMSCNRPVTSESCATSEDNPDQELAEEHHRLQTFTNFPSSCPVSSSVLARAGFFYTGEGDHVRCFSCHATIGGWQPGDSAIGRHRTTSPSCKFVSSFNSWKNDTCPVPSNCHPRVENGSADASLQPAHDLSSDLCADYLLRSGQVVDLSDTVYPRNPAMCREETRLRSFNNWPSYAPITPKELASAGLYYTGIDDQVECFCCGGKLRNWEPCDQAWAEHSRHFPRCFFVLGRDSGNLPNHSADAELERSDLCNTTLLHNPSMANYETRIKTFVTWRYPVSKERLAQAGFYSIGNGDNVVCFHCGGGLQKWEVGEDPWEQHAKWFPGCKYLVDEKGKDFVNSVHLTHSLENSTIEATEKSLLLTDEELLQNQSVQEAMRMGFSLEEIRKTLERRRHLSIEHYISVEALVTDLINAQRDHVRQVASESTLQEDLSTEEKLRRLQEEKLCKICMDKTISVVLIPCGHLVACSACAEAVDKCPLCCAVISKRQAIYTS